jgi:hypothetical protein
MDLELLSSHVPTQLRYMIVHAYEYHTGVNDCRNVANRGYVMDVSDR